MQDAMVDETLALESLREDKTPVAYLFQGVNTFTGSGRATRAVTGEVGPPTGGSVKYIYKRCLRETDVTDTIDVSTAASASFGAYSVDAKAEYVRSLQLTTYSLTITVYAEHVTGTQVPQTSRWAEGVKAPSEDGVNPFLVTYGDSYVSSITAGACYIASYVFRSQTESEQQEVIASLEAQGVVDGGTVSGSLSTNMDNAMQNVNVEVSIVQEVFGLKDTAVPDSPGGIAKFAMEFGNKPVDAEIILNYTTTGYDNLPDMPSLNGLKENQQTFSRTYPLIGILQRADSLQAIIVEIDQMNVLYRRYGHTDDSLGKYREKYVGDYGRLTDWLEGTLKAPNTANPEPADGDFAQMQTPVMVAVLSSVASPGNPGGGSPLGTNKDLTTKWVRQGLRVRSFQMRGGENLDKIIVQCTGTSGKKVTIEGGSNKGGLSDELMLDDGDYIKRFEGYYKSGGVVNYLKVTTSTGNVLVSSSQTPDPKTHLSFDAAATGFVVGFKGRTGSHVDQIEPIQVIFDSTKWLSV